MLTRAQKETIIAEVASVASGAQSAIAAEYRGMSVEEMTSLRSEARKAGVYLRVVKNTLARRALSGTAYECMRDSLVGPLVLAFSKVEPSAAAKVMSDFAKGHEKLVIKAVALQGKLLSPSDIKALATMPSRDQAISMLMAMMKAPVEKLARTLAAPTTKLVRTVVAIRDQKQAA